MVKNKAAHQFVFGYGSLMCPVSRAITAPEQAHKVATPVSVHGVQRTWNKRGSDMTAMGVSFKQESKCVGVLVPVNQTELSYFDTREEGYDRVSLDLEQVDRVDFLDEDGHYQEADHDAFLDLKRNNDEERIRIWTYMPQNPEFASPEHPIAQSYLDIILRGCLSISEEFAKEFITSTRGWHQEEILGYATDSEMTDSSEGSSNTADSIWVDDRHAPVYVRSDSAFSLEHGNKLDRLVRKYRPYHFDCRRVYGCSTL